MLNPAFWWLLCSLVGSKFLGCVYHSKQQACQGLNHFQIFNFSAVVEPLVVRTKKNQMEIMKQYLLRNVLLFENYGQEVGGPIHCWSPTEKWGTSLPRSLRLLRLWWRQITKCRSFSITIIICQQPPVTSAWPPSTKFIKFIQLSLNVWLSRKNFSPCCVSWFFIS